MEEPGKVPDIQVRLKPGEKEEEDRKGAGLILPSGSAAANAPAVGALSEAGVVVSQQGGLIARLLSPLRSVVNFFRTAASLGFIEGTKFALRNVVVQGLLAGLAVAVIAGVFIGPAPEKTGKNSTGVFPSSSSKLAPEEVRGNGLYGAIPGIYEKVMARLRGGSAAVPAPAPEESAKEGEAGEKAEEKKGDDAAAAEEAAAKAKMAGSASPFMRGKLEKLANLFGSGSGGGAGGGGSMANLPVGAKGSSAAGGNQPKGGGAGKLDAMKRGRVKIPLRGGERQAAFSGAGAKRQLRNAALAGQLSGRAADGQGAATLAALPFDGAKVPGGNVADTPGSGIGPWVPGGGSPGGGPGPSNLGGGGPIPTDPPPGIDDPPAPICPDGQIMNASNKCIPNPCNDNELPGPDGTCTEVVNVTPYQADLNRAMALAGEAQAIENSKMLKWLKYLAYGLFALAICVGLGIFGAAAKEGASQAVDLAAKGVGGLTKTFTRITTYDEAGRVKAVQDSVTTGGADAVQEGAKTGTEAAKKGIRLGHGSITTAVAIAGIGIMMLQYVKSQHDEAKAKVAEARELATNIQSLYDETPVAGRIKNAADTKCTADGRPKIKDPVECGYRPDLSSQELKDFSKCMTAPTCTPKS